MSELRKLLDQGYEVTLQSGGPVDRERDEYPGYWAHVRLGGGPLHTASGKTPELAVWNASPIHRDDERPMLPPLAVIIESALANRSDDDSGWLTDMMGAAWRDGVRYGEMDDKARRKADEDRRRLYKKLTAIVSRPHLRLVQP